MAGKKLKNGAVGTGQIADGAVTGAKIATGAVDTLPPVYMHFSSTGTFIPGESRGVVSINQPVPNVACLDLDSPAKTGGATRGLGAGAPPITTPQIGVPPAPVNLGCPASHGDAVVQLAAATGVNEVYAWFDY